MLLVPWSRLNCTLIYAPGHRLYGLGMQLNPIEYLCASITVPTASNILCSLSILYQ